LRERRNGIVHDDAGSDQILTLVHELKGYVESLIHFHLAHRGSFATLPDVAQFLDLPPDLDKLKELQQLYRRAARFRQPRPEEEEPGASSAETEVGTPV
jgi:hypothetical protein